MKWWCRRCYFIRFWSIIQCDLKWHRNVNGLFSKAIYLKLVSYIDKIILQYNYTWLPSLFRLSYFLRYRINFSLLFLHCSKNDTWLWEKNSGRKNRLLTLLLREKKKVFQSDKMKETEESGYNYIVKLLNRFTPSTSEEWL